MVRGLIHRGMRFIRRQRKPFKVNLLKNVVQNFSLALTQQYRSLFITGLGAGAVELGYVNSAGGVAEALISVPMGWLASRYGVRRIFLSGLPLMILGSVVFGLAESWEITAIALIVSMLSLRIMMTGCPLVCGNTLENRERATGMQLCDTLSALPRLVAPTVAAYVINLFGGMNSEGIRPLFWIQGLGLLASFILIQKLFTDPMEIDEDSESPTLLGDLERVFGEGLAVKRWIVYLMLSTFPYYLSQIFTPLYAAQVKGADEFTLGWMFTASWLLVIALALPVGRLADRFGRKKLIIIMTPLYCASPILLVHAWSNPALIFSGLLSGFFMLMAVTQGAITAELVPRGLLGSWYGLLGLFRGLVNVVSPTLGGAIWESLSPETLFYLLAATQAVKLFILITMPSQKTGAESP